MGKRDWEMNQRQRNIYNNLWQQVHRTFDWRTHHQGKRGTERYRNGVNAFCKHLAIKYGSKNFKNINDKHLESFIKVSQEAGISASTIKTDLSAIRKLL
ncbi:site-specific integrase [Bacillus kwashiorkori]|uniref:site-specific integrase n=1 Tax=Bacillus kwashiorkori TaxID=1522318 RepID=UPI0007813E5E|nr:site-specific integrase [Bacillus kwashiorkori]